MKVDLEAELNKEQEDIDNTPLTFGKYKGDTPNEVAEKDPKYILWIWKNLENAAELTSEELYISCEYDDPIDSYF